MKNKLKTLKNEKRLKLQMGFGNSEQNFGMMASKFTMAMWYTHRFAHSKYANRVIFCLYYIDANYLLYL